MGVALLGGMNRNTQTREDTMSKYKIERTYYGTWAVWHTPEGARSIVFETTNKVKAQGVLEYLRLQGV